MESLCSFCLLIIIRRIYVQIMKIFFKINFQWDPVGSFSSVVHCCGKGELKYTNFYW